MHSHNDAHIPGDIQIFPFANIFHLISGSHQNGRRERRPRMAEQACPAIETNLHIKHPTADIQIMETK